MATRLVEPLADAALERSFRSFGASYLTQQCPIAAMFAHAGGAELLISHGVAVFAVDLDHERTRRAGGHG